MKSSWEAGSSHLYSDLKNQVRSSTAGTVPKYLFPFPVSDNEK